jgi:ribose/xylose/arabinose/galactoside ABC-type transport system permease subunit
MDLPVRVVCDTVGGQVLRRRHKIQLTLGFSLPGRGVAQLILSSSNPMARINSLRRFTEQKRKFGRGRANFLSLLSVGMVFTAILALIWPLVYFRSGAIFPPRSTMTMV